MTTLGEKLREAIDKKINEEVMKKTITAWDTHEDAIRKPQQEKEMANPNPVATRVEDLPHFSISNNVMRETFNIVKEKPNLVAKQYIDMLVARGFKESSVTSVVYQLVRAGQITRSTYGLLHVAQDEYTPIKQIKSKKQAAPAPVVEEKPKRKIVLIKRRKTEDTAQGIAALKADGGAPSLQDMLGAPKMRGFHPSSIVDNLSVLHARELYDYLKKIFTGEIK